MVTLLRPRTLTERQLATHATVGTLKTHQTLRSRALAPLLLAEPERGVVYRIVQQQQLVPVSVARSIFSF